MNPPHLLTEWARLLIGALYRAGVRDAVISPGSRSTPFTWAALQCQGLRCHSIIDERAAGFFAVGQAKLSRRPSLLIATSGTAVANYLPAVIESAQSHTPLIVLSADRPFVLQAAHAPQTIDQVKLFGDYARLYLELAMPDPASLAALPRYAAQSVHLARFPLPGPVHLNARAQKPLEPVARSDDELTRQVDALLERGPTRVAVPRLEADAAELETLARAAARCRRGLIVLGPLPAPDAGELRALQSLAHESELVVLCEAAGQLRFAQPALWNVALCDGFDTLLRDRGFAANLKPDFVLEFGLPPVSSGWERFVAEHPEMPRHLVTAHGWPDPHNSAASIVYAEPYSFAARLATLIKAERRTQPDSGVEHERRAWREAWLRANASVWQVVDSELRHAPTFGEGAAARCVVRKVPAESVLAVGNSLPIRHLDLYCPARTDAISVVSQRGTNGIDGVISSAAGVASVARRPTTLIVGDMSFLHDLNGLWAAARLDTTFVVVVLNNRGGRIFEQLPLSETPTESLDYWLTPHELDLSRGAALYGVPHYTVDSEPALEKALADAYAASGASVVIVRVGAHDARQQALAIQERLHNVLGGER